MTKNHDQQPGLDAGKSGKKPAEIEANKPSKAYEAALEAVARMGGRNK